MKDFEQEGKRYAIPEWKQRYQEAYDEYQIKNYPSSSKDFGTLKIKPLNITKANGLRRFCCNYCKWTGNHLEPTQNMGRPIQKYIPKFIIFSGNVEQLMGGIDWQKGSGINGSSDAKGHINNPRHTYPIPVYVEIKVGRDTQSDDQKDYQAIITETKAFYVLVNSPEKFFTFYDYILSL